jgi:hypothetical protein
VHALGDSVRTTLPLVPRLMRIALALLGFVCAIFGVGLLVSAVFDTHRTSRILDGIVGTGILGVSFFLYRSLGWARSRSAG